MCMPSQQVNDNGKRFEINSHLVCSAAGNSDCDSQRSVSLSLKTESEKTCHFSERGRPVQVSTSLNQEPLSTTCD